jgi:ribosomal protein L22
MSPSKPPAPSEGTPDEAKLEQEAAESNTAEAEAKPKRARRKPAAKAAAGEPTAEAKPKPKTRAKAAAKPKADAKPADEAAADAPKPRRTRRKAEPKVPAAPSSRAKRPSRDYGDSPPMVRAHAKYVRTSARKARLVCDHIRGKSVEEARAILAHASRDVARDWSKLLESAVANAEHNHELIGDELRIAAVKADEGPTLKRFRPRAMGRATKIRKRTSHLSITLTPKDGE